MSGFHKASFILIISLVLIVLAGSYHPSSAFMISALYVPKKRGRTLGFHSIGGGGNYFLYLIISAAIAAHWGWREPFIGLAMPTMIFGNIFCLFLSQRAKSSETQQTVTPNDNNKLFSAKYLPRLVPFLILTIFTQVSILSTVLFIPLYIVKYFGISEEIASAFIYVIFFAVLWKGSFGGYLSDHIGQSPVIIATYLITGSLIYLLNIVLYRLGIGVLLLVFGIVLSHSYAVAQTYIIEQVPESRSATIYGIFYFANMETGRLFTPIIGYFIDHIGFHYSFAIIGIAMFGVVLVCLIFLQDKRN